MSQAQASFGGKEQESNVTVMTAKVKIINPMNHQVNVVICRAHVNTRQRHYQHSSLTLIDLK